MAHKNIDRCKETTSTTGTGTLTLTGAVSGFAAVADATIGLTSNGDTGWFCAENGAEWEVFLGTRVDATHLARTTVLSSSNAGAAVSFTAAPTVFSTVPGAKVTSGGPAFSAYLAADQTVTTATLTKVTLDAEEFDVGACFDATTNRRFTPNVAGYYQVSWCVRCMPASGALSDAASILYKNGASHKLSEFVGTTTSFHAPGSCLVYMNGTTDYLELYIYAVGTTPKAYGGSNQTFMSGYLARPA